MTTTQAVAEPKRSRIDLFTAAIMRSYLISTVQEMMETTIRAAYSTCFSEGLDFTCAFFDSQARMIAQAYGLPVHSGALFDPVKTLLSTYDTFEEGDVIVFNDPYNGGSHQADVVVARPIFLDGDLMGFGVNRGHWVDVGGMSPGGWSGTVRHVIQEALIIPPAKLYKAGVLDREIRDFILKNVRIPKQCWGDIQAQIASNITAERRLRELAQKYGAGAVLEGMEQALSYSKRRFTKKLGELPDGQWEGEDYIEDDGHGGGPYTVHVTLKKEGEKILVDFDGTDPQVRGPVNCTYTETKAGSYTALVDVVDPFVPLNSGLIEAIEVKAPIASMVNPVYPAPVFATTSDPINRVHEAVMKAISKWLPDRVVAGGYATQNDCTGGGDHPETGEEFIWYHFGPGGIGARATKDGRSMDTDAMVNSRAESMELWESRFPLEFDRLALITNSGGAGENRGGLGASRHMRITSPTSITGCADRQKIPPWGLFGGKEGFPNKMSIIRDGKERDFPSLFGTFCSSKFSNVPLNIGDIFDISAGGGGGYGDPLNRDVQKVEWDVLNGYVSPDHAEQMYGVWIDPKTGKADKAKTAELRERLKKQQKTVKA